MNEEKRESLYNLFWIFIVGCAAGWVIEGLYTYFKRGVLINHTALVIGPFNLAYGFGACMLTYLLYKHRNEGYWKIFLIGFIGGSIIEYIMSWGMEWLLGFTAWDYSNKPWNINGRICFLYSLFWGFLAIVWIKFLYPKVMKFIKKMNYDIGKKLAIFLIIFIFFDILLTFSAIDRAREKEKGIAPQNKYEEILDKTFNKKYLTNMFNNNWGSKE